MTYSHWARLSRATTGFLAAGAVMSFASACLNLEVTNPNALDLNRAYLNPATAQASIVGGWKNATASWEGRTVANCPTIPLSNWANEMTSTTNANGLTPRNYASEPRLAIDNYDVQNCVTRYTWDPAYLAIAGAREGYQAIIIHNHKFGDTTTIATGADTPRLKLFARFIIAIQTIRLGLLFDQSFITDETTNPTTVPTLSPYQAVLAAGVSQLRKIIADAKAAPDFTLPSDWINQNPITRDELVRLSYAWITRAEVYGPRTKAERDAVNWAAVLARLDSGITRDFTEKADPAVGGTTGTWINTSFNNSTFRMHYRFLGPADTSGEYQAWLALNFDRRRAFVISTPDRRIHATGNANAAGTRFARQTTSMSNLATQGDYLNSWYRSIRYLNTTADSGSKGNIPYVTLDEMKFIRAEALYRLGQKQAAADLINLTRVPAGLRAVGVDGPPNNASCVPRKGNGTCGDLFDAIKYEKRIELFPYLAEVSFADTRGWGELITGTPLHIPASGRDLANYGMRIYTFGGGGEGSAP